MERTRKSCPYDHIQRKVPVEHSTSVPNAWKRRKKRVGNLICQSVVGSRRKETRGHEHRGSKSSTKIKKSSEMLEAGQLPKKRIQEVSGPSL